jgi:D-alanine-D-alanine ligase
MLKAVFSSGLLQGSLFHLWQNQKNRIMKKIAVLCGGFSGESVVSLKSAAMVMDNIDRSLYSPFKVEMDRNKWIAYVDGGTVPIDRSDFTFTHAGKKHGFDAVFMMIHGTPGEDGVLQGYFELLNIPVTSGGVTNMSLTFNKKLTTRILGSMGYNVAKSLVVKRTEGYSSSFIIRNVGLPCFVKPNCGGSSIGASRVNVPEELHLAVDKALSVGDQVIIEEFIEGTEVTNGVIVINEKVTALPITEIVSKKAFFDFEAKYQGASEEITPARLPEDLTLRIRQTSEDIYRKLDCAGMIRIDYLIREGELFVVEVNTVPGFSEASIIPQQAAVAGMDKKALISTVLQSIGM